MTAKKYRTLGIGDKRPKGYELNIGGWMKGSFVGAIITKDDLRSAEYRTPIVKRKKAGKKK